MKLSSAIASKAALLAVLSQSTSAFAPNSIVPHAPPARQFSGRQHVQESCVKLNSANLADQCLLTPEGYGFSSTAERIIAEARRGEAGGYFAANANDRVIDVMEGITAGDEDVALVYDNSELMGIFTESDYINVCDA